MVASRTNGSQVDESFDCPMTFVVNGVALETTWQAIPIMNRVNSARRGLRHKLSNESYASAIATETFKTAAGLTDKMTKDERAKAITTYREANPDAWNDALNAEIAKNWDIICNGEIGELGTRGDSVESEFLRLVDKQLTADFKGKKGADGKAMKVPTNDTDTMTFADGETWTRKELRDFIISRDGEKLRAQAEEIVALRKAAVDSKPEVAAIASAADMGFTKQKAA